MKDINPFMKLLGVFIPAIILAFTYLPELNFTVFGIIMIYLVLRSDKLKQLFLFMIPVLILCVGMFFTGYQFRSDAYIGAQEGLFTDAAVYNGLQLSSRVLVFAVLGLVFVMTTDKMVLVRSLEQKLRLPPKFVYGVLAAWELLPNIKYEYTKTRTAFRARGLNPAIISPKLLTPMLVKAVRWSEALSSAMESKGFNGNTERSYYEKIRISYADIAFPVITTLLTILGIVILY